VTLPFGLLAITPAVHPKLPDAIRQVVYAAGPQATILLRDKSLSPPELRYWAEQILPICQAAGSLMLVHGHPEIARRVGADGVHLTERGATPAEARAIVGPEALVGISRHDPEQLRGSAGADYATLSPIFATAGKGEPLGLQVLAETCRVAALPVVALGGITPERATQCRTAGAAAVAAIQAVWEGDPGSNALQIIGLLDAGHVR
jgi:thiamine-phosphate pyrophosphorylase